MKVNKIAAIICVSALAFNVLKPDTVIHAADGVEINITNFPNTNFRNYVKSFDLNNDGTLSGDEIDKVTEINIGQTGDYSKSTDITDLTGIGFFTSLTKLICCCNNLATLDVSKNTKLTYLDCQTNNLATLDVSKNTALTYLDCWDNLTLTALDVSKNLALEHLNCGVLFANGNKISTLDLSNNTKLTYLVCSNTKITSLDVSKNTKLTYLNCSGNNFESLDISKNTALTNLNCQHDNLSTLDVSKNIALKTLWCGWNQLKKLDVSMIFPLNDLSCEYNQLTSLNLSMKTYMHACFIGSQTYDSNIYIGKDGKYQVDIRSFVPDLSRVSVSGDETIYNGVIESSKPEIVYKYDSGFHNIDWGDDGIMDVTLNSIGTPSPAPEPSSVPTTDTLFQNHPEFLNDSETNEILKETQIVIDDYLKQYTFNDDVLMSYFHNLSIHQQVSETLYYIRGLNGGENKFDLANRTCAQRYIVELCDDSVEEFDKRCADVAEDANKILDYISKNPDLSNTSDGSTLFEGTFGDENLTKYSAQDLDNLSKTLESNKLSDSIKDGVKQGTTYAKKIVELMLIYLQIYDLNADMLDKSIELFDGNEKFCNELKTIKKIHFGDVSTYINECIESGFGDEFTNAIEDALTDNDLIGTANKIIEMAGKISNHIVFEDVDVDEYIYTIIQGGNYSLSTSSYSEAVANINLKKQSESITEGDVTDFRLRYEVQMSIAKAYLKQLQKIETNDMQKQMFADYYNKIDTECTYDKYYARCVENMNNSLNPTSVKIRQTSALYDENDVSPKSGTIVDETYVPNGIKINFNTPVNLGNGSIKLYQKNNDTNDTLLATATNINISSDGKLVTFDFNCNLNKSSSLYILIDEGTFISKVNPNLAFDGISSKEIWKITVAQDTPSAGLDALGQLAASQFAYQKIHDGDVGMTVMEYAEKYKADDYQYYLYRQKLSDWIIVDSKEDAATSSYHAVILKHKYSNNYVLAYRGIESTNLDMDRSKLMKLLSTYISDDFLQFHGEFRTQINDAISTYDTFVGNNPTANVVLTGHSLGGTLANYVSYIKNAKARTFNSLYCMADAFNDNPQILDENFSGTDNEAEEDFNKSLRIDYVNQYDDNAGGYIGMYNNRNKTSVIVEGNKEISQYKQLANHMLDSMITEQDQYSHTYRLNNPIQNNLICQSNDQVDTGFVKVKSFRDAQIGKFDGYTIFGTSYDDKYYGEKYWGANSKETVFGGDGKDFISTLKNDDVLVGGRGDDELHGGDGDDKYYYHKGDGVDTIEDPSGKDKIIIDGFESNDILSTENEQNGMYFDIKINNQTIIKVNRYKNHGSSLDIDYNDSSNISCTSLLKDNGWSLFEIFQCPITLDFINSTGDVVASLGNQEKSIENEYGYFYSFKNKETGEYEKCAYVFGDVKVNVTGTDSGTMDMSTEKIGDNTKSYVLQNIPINTMTKIEISNDSSSNATPSIVFSNENQTTQLSPIMYTSGNEPELVAVTGISLSDSEKTVNIGDAVQLQAYLAPSNSTDKTISWESNDTNIATVDQNGKVQSNKCGTVIIRATSGNGHDTQMTLNVVKPVTGVSIPSSASVQTGKTVNLSAEVAPADASNKAVNWSSSNTGVASVNNGTVTGISAGTAIITVTTSDGNHQSSCTVTVSNPPAPVIEPAPTPAPAVEKNDMYRLYNPNSGEHFFTANSEERDYLSSIGWTYEGVAWSAPKTSNTPVYRLYNGNGGEHHYTTSMEEANVLTGIGWSLEGIGWYSDDAQGQPLYRMYNPNAFANNHHYTTSEDERDYLVSIGWSFEGTGWYGCN